MLLVASCYYVMLFAPVPLCLPQVAARPIRRGELVLREAPLLGLPESFDGDLEELMNQTSLRRWSCNV